MSSQDLPIGFFRIGTYTAGDPHPKGMYPNLAYSEEWYRFPNGLTASIAHDTRAIWGENYYVAIEERPEGGRTITMPQIARVVPSWVEHYDEAIRTLEKIRDWENPE